jgi:phosphoribosylaminoimidazole-succinocarboxamide synthase
MNATGWDHEPPAPHLSPEAIANTRAKYIEAYELLSGESFDTWYAPDD